MDLKLGQHLRALPGPILITGHTGFKGTWLTFLLERLGVNVIGYSLEPEKNSLYERTERSGKIPEMFADIRDMHTFRKFLDTYKPSAIIHMAAQPLVLESYKNPKETFDINVMGTVNVLDSAFLVDYVRTVLVVTTDKVYRNDDSGRAFVETDPLEGKDPYSASKVATEAAISAWRQVQKVSGGPKVFSVRAGNVIGGGDWAKNRLIPDLVRGFISGEQIEIRNSVSTRPWQHVLDPLVGYVMALEYVLQGGDLSAMNFAPKEASFAVSKIVEIACECWPSETKIKIINDAPNKSYESTSLSLDSSFAHLLFGEYSKWNQQVSVTKTIEWWIRVTKDQIKPAVSVQIDISEYLDSSFL
jgi:CDP-glucose 4,6-dehydratase